MIKIISIDLNSLDSINKSERLKAILENKGYSYKKIISNGFDKFKLFYEKIDVEK